MFSINSPRYPPSANMTFTPEQSSFKTRMTRYITKLSVTPNSADEFPEVVSTVYNMAMIGRKGGVIIDFPYNVQKTCIAGR